jgi:hypothetical protein
MKFLGDTIADGILFLGPQWADIESLFYGLHGED